MTLFRCNDLDVIAVNSHVLNAHAETIAQKQLFCGHPNFECIFLSNFFIQIINLICILYLRQRLMFVFREFVKRCNDQSPFHYWTLNETYRVEEASFNDRPDLDHPDGDLPDLDHPDGDHNYHHENPLRLHHMVINRRDDSAVFTAGRAFMPARHRPHLRERLYRPEVGLPHVPDI